MKKDVKQLQIKQKKQKGGFLGILLGTLAPSLLGNMFAGKGVIQAGKRTIRAEQDF